MTGPTADRTARLARGVAATVVAAAFLAPLVLVVGGSLTLPGRPPTGGIRFLDPFSTLAYDAAYAIEPLGAEAWRSLLVAAICVPLAVAASSMAGFVIATAGPRARRLGVGLCLLLLVVPEPVLWIPRLILFREGSMIDTLWPYALPAAAGLSPFFVLIFVVAYVRLPASLWDVARVEGRGPFGIWFHVALPLGRGALTAVAVLAFVAVWGDATTPLLYTTTDAGRTLALGLRALGTLESPLAPVYLAGAVVATVPVLALVLAGQRRLLGSRAWFTALAVALVATGAAGCGGAGGEPPEPTVRVMVTGEVEEVTVYQALARTYEQSFPGRRVTIDPVEDDAALLTKLASQSAAGSPPDAFLVDFRKYAAFAAQGALAEPPAVSAGDRFDAPLRAFTRDGRLACVPQNASSLVVYVNTDLLPDVPARWTWDEFAATAERVGLATSPRLIRAAPFVWGAGGALVDDEAAPTRTTLDTPEGRRGLGFIVDLVRRAGPTADELAGDSEKDAFVRGDVGLLLESRREVPELRETAGLRFDVAPLPVGPSGQPVSMLHADGYCVSAGAEHADAARAFVAWAVGTDGATLTALAGRTVPALRPVAESPAFLDPSRPPARSQVFLDQIPVLRAVPTVPRWPEVEDVADDIVERAFYEEGFTVDEAVRELDRASAGLLGADE